MADRKLESSDAEPADTDDDADSANSKRKRWRFKSAGLFCWAARYNPGASKPSASEPEALARIWSMAACDWDVRGLPSGANVEDSQLKITQLIAWLDRPASLQAAWGLLNSHPWLANQRGVVFPVIEAWLDRTWGKAIRALTESRYPDWMAVLAWMLEPRQQARFKKYHRKFGKGSPEDALQDVLWAVTQAPRRDERAKLLRPDAIVRQGRPALRFPDYLFSMWQKHCVRGRSSWRRTLEPIWVLSVEEQVRGPHIRLKGAAIRDCELASVGSVTVEVTRAGRWGGAAFALRLDGQLKSEQLIPPRGRYRLVGTGLTLHFADATFRVGDKASWQLAWKAAHELPSACPSFAETLDLPFRTRNGACDTAQVARVFVQLLGRPGPRTLGLVSADSRPTFDDDVRGLLERHPKLAEQLLAIDAIGISRAHEPAHFCQRSHHPTAWRALSPTDWKQILSLLCAPGQEPLVRAITAARLKPEKLLVWLLLGTPLSLTLDVVEARLPLKRSAINNYLCAALKALGAPRRAKKGRSHGQPR